MLNLKRIKPNWVIGIELDEYLVKAVKLNKIGNEFKIEDYIAIDENDLATNLLAVLAQLNISPQTKIALALKDEVVLTKIIELDANLQETEIADYLTFNLKNYTDLEASEIKFDFITWPKTDPSKIKKPILLLMTRAKNVEQKLVPFKNYAHLVKLIDTEAFTLAKLAAYQFGEQVIMVNHFKQHSLLSCLVRNHVVLDHKTEPITKLNNQTITMIAKQFEIFKLAHRLEISQILLSGEIYGESIVDQLNSLTMQTSTPCDFLLPINSFTQNNDDPQFKICSFCQRFTLSYGLALSGFEYA